MYRLLAVALLVAKFDASGSVENRKRLYERDDPREEVVVGHVAMDCTLANSPMYTRMT